MEYSAEGTLWRQRMWLAFITHTFQRPAKPIVPAFPERLSHAGSRLLSASQIETDVINEPITAPVSSQGIGVNRESTAIYCTVFTRATSLIRIFCTGARQHGWECYIRELQIVTSFTQGSKTFMHTKCSVTPSTIFRHPCDERQLLLISVAQCLSFRPVSQSTRILHLLPSLR